MYSMERFATAIYRVQKGGFKNNIHEKLVYAVDNEQQHVFLLRERLIGMKKTPFPLAFLFQYAGILLGCISRCTGKVLALKIDVAIEKRAVKDYNYFLRTLTLDDETKVVLKKIITDEELHIRNWLDSLKVLKNMANGNR
jgi:demethoxyubiquinone hydroxylase (CLK1/Coq7/Cat5 family)